MAVVVKIWFRLWRETSNDVEREGHVGGFVDVFRYARCGFVFVINQKVIKKAITVILILTTEICGRSNRV